MVDEIVKSVQKSTPSICIHSSVDYTQFITEK